MTDRIRALTVALETDLRVEVADELIAVIRQLRGVLAVTPLVADASGYVADARAKRDLGVKLWDVLYPKSQ